MNFIYFKSLKNIEIPFFWEKSFFFFLKTIILKANIFENLFEKDAIFPTHLLWDHVSLTLTMELMHKSIHSKKETNKI